MSEHLTNHDAAEVLGLWQTLGQYLQVHVEADHTPPADPRSDTTVMVIIANTAPAAPEWPEIVFVGVKVDVPLKSGNKLRAGSSKRGGKELPSPPIEPLHNYEGSVQPEPPEVLHPGQFITFEYTCPFNELPALEFQVQGTVSPYRFFRRLDYKRVPTELTKPTALPRLRVFNEIQIHRLLHSALTALPSLGPGTTLAELQPLPVCFRVRIQKSNNRSKGCSILHGTNLGSTSSHLAAPRINT